MLDMILKDVLPNLERTANKHTHEWYAFIKKDIELFKDSQKKLNGDLTKHHPDKPVLTYQRKLSEHLDLHVRRLKSETLDNKDWYSAPPWQELVGENGLWCDSIEETCALPFNEIGIEPSGTSSKWKRWHEQFLMMKYNIKRKRARNRAAKKGVQEKQRVFNSHQFIQYFIVVPAAALIYKQWQACLQLYSEMLEKMHNASEALKDNTICAECLASAEASYWEDMRKYDLRKSNEQYLSVIKELREELEHHKKAALKENENFIQNMKDDISEKWLIAGSPLLSGGVFNEKKIARKWKGLEQDFSRDQKKWKNHFQGSQGDWLKDLELSKLQLSVIEKYEHTLELIHNTVQKNLRPAFNAINADVHKSLEVFKKENEIQKPELRKEVLAESRSLVKLLRQQKLPHLLDTITQADFVQTFHGFFRRIEKDISQLTDVHLIYKECDLDHIPPDTKVDQVHFKELIDDEILSRANQNFKTLEANLSRELESTLRRISSLDQIVEFNLDAAYNLLKERSDENAVVEAREIAVSGLERTKSNLKELEGEINEDLEKNTEHFGIIVRKLLNELQKLSDSEKIIELRLRVARVRARERLVETRNKIWRKIKGFFPRILRIALHLIHKAKSTLFQLRKVTRLGPQESLEGDHITRFLIDTHKKIGKMPYVYQRLFRFDPLEEKRFFYGRSAVLEQISSDFQNYKEGYQAVTALVGEKGNGKTTIVNFCEKEIFTSFNVIKINCTDTIYTEVELLRLLNEAFEFSDVSSIEAFEEKIKSLPHKQVCIVENIQNLFLRVIDGFDVMEQFLLLIAQTGSNVFWMVSCGLYAWQYLDRVLQISDYFKRIIVLNALELEDIKQVILTRHQVSGYGLQFAVPEKVLKSRQYKKISGEEQKQEYLRDLFFDELTDISGGNIKSALIFWLSAINAFDEEDINIAGEINLDKSALFQLYPEEYFTLAALIQHDVLTEEQHAYIFNQEPDVSRSILGRLNKKGFLEWDNAKYSVHPLLYRPVIITLKSKNILN